MITKPQARKLKRAIKNLGDARSDSEWAGAGDPADIPQIEQRYASAKRRVATVIAELTVADAQRPQ